MIELGDMAELLEWQHDREYQNLLNEYGPGLWTTRHGETFKINEMTSFHIKNVIRYLQEHRDFLNIQTDIFPENDTLREAKLDEFTEQLEINRKNIWQTRNTNLKK